MRRLDAARLVAGAIAGAAAALVVPSAASAAGCPSEQSVLPYGGNNPPYQCAQVHKSGKKSLDPWATKSWTKSIAYGYPVKYHCKWANGSGVSVSEAYTTSSYTATATNWETKKKNWAAGVLFTTGNIDGGGYKSGCGHEGEIQNSIQKISSLKLSGGASTGIVGKPMTFTASLSPSSAPGGVGLQANGTTVAQGALSGGAATLTWTPAAAGTYTITAGYGGNTSSCPSTASTCGYTGAQSNSVTVVISEDPATTATTTSTTPTTTTPTTTTTTPTTTTTTTTTTGTGETTPASGSGSTMALRAATAFVAARAPRDDFGLVTRTRTRKLPARLALACPRGSVVMNAETLTATPAGRVALVERRHGAAVRTTKATRGHRVTLQVTCRRAALPRLATARLGYGTPRADRMSTARGSAALFGGPGRDRLKVRHDKGAAFGGLGRDVVVVSARDGVGNGGPGDDRLVATRSARALLVGGPGHDRIVAARGATFVNAADGERDHITCASAKNRVLVDRKDVVTGPCRPVRRAS